MTRRRPWVLGALLVSLAGMIACAGRSQSPLSSITRSQREFLRLRELSEKGPSPDFLSKAEAFLTEESDPELVRPLLYYIARHHERLGDAERAASGYNEIVRRYPESGWAELAESGLSLIKERTS
ncbi:MAG: hypothetical protein HY714_05885 [Candidatus Omnitrophica bacterium]|nr:hypothetical protein [Candidatus Omnitrophota bacterium]